MHLLKQRLGHKICAKENQIDLHYLTSILSTRKFEHQSRQIPDLVMLLEQKLSAQKFRQMQWRVLYHLSSPAGWPALRPLLVLVQKSEGSIFRKGAKGHSGMM